MTALGRVSILAPARLTALHQVLRFMREPGDRRDADAPPGPENVAGFAPHSGDPEARHADAVLRTVDQDHGQGLLGLAIRSGLPHDAAEDAVQEALVRLWREVRRGVEILDPRAWTYRTLYRIAMDEHRVRRRAADIAATLSTRTWKSLDPDIAQRISIWALVDQLPTRQRQVLYLRYKADLSYDQIAAVMGISASAARAHATFATERLRGAIGREWDR
jgi:RNA polymerase sigma-70 factor (ECF subfamily)